MSISGWIGVDLDGTLAHYDGVWKGPDHIGEPIEPMMRRVRKWLEDGVEVRIFTARVYDDEGGLAEIPIRKWLQKVGLPSLTITATKDYGMIELWDDRAVSVKTNTGEYAKA